jgi:beta-glucanase (GH16 family)
MRRDHGMRRDHVVAPLRVAFVAVVSVLSALTAACTDQSSGASPSGITLPGSSTTGAAASSTTTTSTLPPLPHGSAWKIAFADQFNGSVLDRARWATCYYWSSTTCTNSSSQELELYTPENVTVASGRLNLTARREVATSDGLRFDYTSGMISGAGPTRTMSAFRYGYVEARARIPAGTGLWSALWLLPSNRAALPEVDIFEIVGYQPGIVREYTHWPTPQGQQQFSNEANLPTAGAGWHVYGLDWEASSLTWFVDGRKVWTMDYRPAVPQQEMVLIANLAVGGKYATAPIAQTPFPSVLRFDYIKVWQHT